LVVGFLILVVGFQMEVVHFQMEVVGSLMVVEVVVGEMILKVVVEEEVDSLMGVVVDCQTLGVELNPEVWQLHTQHQGLPEE